MMGTKLNPGEYDCYNKVLPDEPLFVLLARDPYAPTLIEEWAEERMRAVMMKMRPLEDLNMVSEAQKCAKAMREWRKANDGRWRTVEQSVNMTLEGKIVP